MGSTSSHLNILAMHQAQSLRQNLLADQTQQTERRLRNRTLRRSYWVERLSVAMSDLKALDPTGWATWFDSSAVPDGTPRQLVPYIEARVASLAAAQRRPFSRAIARLYRGVFIWVDATGAFLFRDDNRIVEFVDAAEARAFIDASLVAAVTLGVVVGETCS